MRRYVRMRGLLLTLLLFGLMAGPADARWRHRHHYPSYNTEMPDTMRAPRADAQMPRFSRRSPPTVASLVPNDWQADAANPNWNGRRFLSPDGSSWFAVYSAPAGTQSVSDHMEDVVFTDGETITYVRGERSWIVVSGFKGSRIFYRKAILACAGKAWHHIAFEYPTELKDRMDQFVLAAAKALDETQTNCEQSVSANRP